MSISKQLPLILGLDVGGRPVQWLSWQEAVCLHVRGDIVWTCGTQRILVRGGMNQASGMRTVIDISSIVAIRNAKALYAENVPPTLNNQALFRRDRFCCLFCGEVYGASMLTRDHIVPRSRGGADIWVNVVTACRPCNQKKADKTPEEAGMSLLALPYVPSRIEALLLRKRILADQMDFLLRHVPKPRRMMYT